MAYFAQLDDENVVKIVHCISNAITIIDADGSEDEQRGADFLTELFGGEGRWVQTSYNTRGGVHGLGGTPLRANYCGKGWVYYPEQDCFAPAQPFPSWNLDGVKGRWNPPVEMPEVELGDDGRPTQGYQWNEEQGEWVEFTG